jgi:sporulation protein YlmC with PRC-barrel domain
MKKTVAAALFSCVLLLAGQAFAQTRGQIPGQEPPGQGPQPDQLSDQQTDRQPGQMQAQGMNRANEMLGKSIENIQGQELGDVEDIIFDNQGNITYIVLSRGGVLGVGVELVPIPFDGQRVTIRDDVIIMDIDQQRLEGPPTFGSREWEKLQDQEFQQNVHGYYGNGENREPRVQERQEGLRGQESQKERQDRKSQD